MRFITKGKIYERSAIAEGYSQNGNQWQRMTLVLEVPRGNYSKKVAFNVMTGNIAAVMAFNNGDVVEAEWDIASREYTNKEGIKSWFTQADLLSIKAADTAPVAVSAPIPEAGPAQDDDLPFGNAIF